MDQQAISAPRVLAIVVTHQGGPWLNECLNALSLQDYPELDVVVVDSGSSDTVLPVVQKNLAEAEFVRIDENVGFGAAANRGLESSDKAPGADYYLFLHDDVAMDSSCVSFFVASTKESGAGIIGGKGVDWDRPELLVEVGMSADQFGYPFSGLEEGEIDQGQHDARRQVLYVSNACVLVSRSVIEQGGSWDVGYFAFGEDLDLCIRARLLGFTVLFEPRARYRHAVALARRTRETSASNLIRYYTRRNRPRTIAKNVATYRVALILLLYTFVGALEVVVLAGLRRFNEIGMYPRALFSFLASIPDVARRRRAVQKRKSEPDRRVRRYMVSDFDRARVFAERQFREIELETLAFGTQTLAKLSPAALRTRLSAWIRRPSTLAYLLLTFILALGLRKTLFGSSIAAGTIFPFPSHTGRLIGEFWSSWHNRGWGLGSNGAAPTVLPILWLFALISGGDSRLAQNLLLVVLISVGLIGVNRFVKRRTDFGPARIAAVFLYAVLPALQQCITGGDLGALALYAGIPWVTDIILRMLGPSPGREGDRPATPLSSDRLARDAARIALIVGFVTSLGPSSLISVLYFALTLGVFVSIASWDRRESLRRSSWMVVAVLASTIVLVPWAIEGLRRTGSILGPIFSGRGGGPAFGPLWRGSPLSILFLREKPQAFAIAGVIAVVLGCLVLPGPSRRRESRILVTAFLSFVTLGSLVQFGYLPAPVSSLAAWKVVPLFCIAAMGSHVAAGLKEELPNFSLGWRHVAAGVSLIAVGSAFIFSWLPSIPNWERPNSTLAASSNEQGRSLISYFTSTAEKSGDFRILWLGDDWIDPIRPALVGDNSSYIVSGPEGLTMLDLYPSPVTRGDRALTDVVDALLARRVHLAGHLLAPMSIRFIAIRTANESLNVALERQSDFALQQQQGGVSIYLNLRWLPRASVAPQVLARTPDDPIGADRYLILREWSSATPITNKSRTAFFSEIKTEARATVLLDDNFNTGWSATVGQKQLVHRRSFGWANAFDLPAKTAGTLRITFEKGWIRALWLIAETLVALLILAIARGNPSGQRPTS